MFNENSACSFCVMPMDSSPQEILGRCFYCSKAQRALEKNSTISPFTKEWQNYIDFEFPKLNNDFDAIIGLSGGIDSSYAAHLLKLSGVRLLGFHVDCGWNSTEAINNIGNLSRELNIPIFTKIINWEVFRELQVAYLRSGVINQDVPQDHLFPILTRKFAREMGINKIVSGWNLATESILPVEWAYSPRDARQIFDIGRLNNLSRNELLDLGVRSQFSEFLLYNSLNKIHTSRPLNQIDFHRDKSEEELSKLYGWQSYGNKHEESRWTKFHQGILLPEKWKIDKRIAHFSSLIVSKQMTREVAIQRLRVPIFNAAERASEMIFVAHKLRLDVATLEEFIASEKRNHSEFAGYHQIRKFKQVIGL